MNFTGERIVWQNPSDHLKEFGMVVSWYIEAMQYAKGKVVADVACGTGFGSFLLSLVALRVYPVDVDVTALEETQALFRAVPHRDHIEMLRDLNNEVVGPTTDLTVSIETIEHLDNPDFFLSHLSSPALFFTIPCYGDKNPFHKIQYSEESAKALIIKYFPNLTYRMEKRRMIGYATK